MTIQLLLLAIVVLLLACIGLLVALLRRPGQGDTRALETRLALVGEGQERAERAVRDEIARSREEAGHAGHLLRAEVGATLKGVGDTVVRTMGEMASAQKQQLDGMATRVGTLTTTNGEQLDRLRAAVEGKLDQIREDNSAKLEQVRQTVDEKLQGVLEQRLGESFGRVSERLEQVHRGLGEMQTLASGVGDLKKVLANVKVRGTWGEMQLGNLLEQVLAPEQYAANVCTNDYNGARVEFAIRLPGHDLGPVWLPIDAKFPVEDYQRLLEAQDAADAAGMDAASRQLEQRIRACAREISLKYLNPPQTTDFAIMFLPTEGLYAEVVRRLGLVDAIQRESRVVVAGPTTLWAILNSLQMGFRTLAIQQRSGEVWEVLGAVKTEFGKFGEVLAKVRKKLHSVSREMDHAGVRTRAIQRRLRDVEELPGPDAQRLLAVEGLVVSEAVDGDGPTLGEAAA
jgi:DNA recombination protein RmuC